MMAAAATTRLRGVLLVLATLLGALGPACQPTPTARPAPAASTAPALAAPSAQAPEVVSGEIYVRWLVERSMLHQAELAARRYSGQGQLWQHPYAAPQPRAASALASVWFTAYPPSQITGPGETVLESLGDPELWRVFRDSGKGADFRLAERGYGDYPGLYHMVGPAGGLDPAPRGAGRQGLDQPGARGGGRPQGARLYRRAAPAHHLPRAGRQGDRLVGHRRRRRRRRQEPALGVPALLQGRAAYLQLARPHLRGAATGGGRRHPLAGHPGRAHAAPRRQRLPRHRGRPQQRPRLV